MSLEGLLAALYDGLRLAVLLLCVGAANVLANPKRLLKAMPAALHEIGVAVTVALSVAPQLIESGQRVRAARRLRGEPGRGFHVFREIALPVMTDALDRSLLLASAMDARGYGRSAAVARPLRATTEALLLGGLIGIGIGTYGLLDSTAPRTLGLPMLLGGVAAGWAGMVLSGRRVSRSRYRPDPWEWEEWCVAGIGLLVASVVVTVSIVDPRALHPVALPPPVARPARGAGRGGPARRAAGLGCPSGAADRDPSARGRARAGARRVITFEHVSITYVDAPSPALRDVDLTIAEGELCVVVGHTGSGKTTFLGAINGLVPHFTGGHLSGRVVGRWP